VGKVQKKNELTLFRGALPCPQGVRDAPCINNLKEDIMKRTLFVFSVVFAAMTAVAVGAAETVIDMYHVSREGTETKIGAIKVEETTYGTLFTPNLSGLTPGLHGFHVHATGNCGPMEKDGHMVAGLAAGGHFDPDKTNAHKGPYGNGHLGDLPALFVDASGMAVHPVLAPRLKVADLSGHSLMLHEGGDNYSDAPKVLGGGGARVACGVVGK
jgi:Cu-Zn family superoxide dismutase